MSQVKKIKPNNPSPSMETEKDYVQKPTERTFKDQLWDDELRDRAREQANKLFRERDCL